MNKGILAKVRKFRINLRNDTGHVKGDGTEGAYCRGDDGIT